MPTLDERVTGLETRVTDLESGRSDDTSFFVTLTREMALLHTSMEREFSVVHRQQDAMGLDIANLRNEVRIEISGLKTEMTGLRIEMTGLKTGFINQQNEMATIKSDFAELKADVAGIKSDMASMKGDVSLVLRLLNQKLGS